jgi:hypothetical protein
MTSYRNAKATKPCPECYAMSGEVARLRTKLKAVCEAAERVLGTAQTGLSNQAVIGLYEAIKDQRRL